MEVVKQGGFTPIYSSKMGQESAKQYSDSLTLGAALMSLYSEPPSEDAALEELESFALDRLKGMKTNS